MRRCDSPLARGLGACPEAFRGDSLIITNKKRLSFWESLLKNEWVTYFLLGNGDGFGHYFLTIYHLDFLLHLFVDHASFSSTVGLLRDVWRDH
ncbi:MAG: hypothetical protein RLZZ358_1386 [Bacteroidota bacterium]